MIASKLQTSINKCIHYIQCICDLKQLQNSPLKFLILKKKQQKYFGPISPAKDNKAFT